MTHQRQTASLAVFMVVTLFSLLFSVPLRAEDCDGLQAGPGNCTVDEDVNLAITLDTGFVLQFNSTSPLAINATIDAFNPLLNRSGEIVTLGGGNLIFQNADIGVADPLTDLTLGANDIWFVSSGSIVLHPSASLTINGGMFGIAPGGALSFISTEILGSAGNDSIDYLSNGVSIGSTGILGRPEHEIDLGAGDDRFLYYQSAGSTIEAFRIRLRDGDDLFAVLGDSVGSIFSGDFFAGDDNDTLAFVSTTATFGSLNSSVNMGSGDDLIDFDSGGGLAGGILLASVLDMSAGNDIVAIGDNALIQIGTSFDLGDDDDLITFTSGGFIDTTAGAFDAGSGNDTIQFNDIAYTSAAAGLTGSAGFNAEGGTFTMGAGDDTILFVSNSIGLNAGNTTINLGSGNDAIRFMTATGFINSVSGAGFLSVDGGADTDIIEFGSANVNAFGAGPTIQFGSSTGAASIVNVETIDVGNGYLGFNGTIDNAASIINFASAEFLGATTDILAFISGSNANGETVIFSSGATLSATTMGLGGADDAFFLTSGATLAATNTTTLGTGDDTFSAGSGAMIAGTVDGGGNANDALRFLSGTTTVSGTGSIINFTSGEITTGATLNIIDNASVPIDLFGTGTLQFGQAASTTNTFTLNNTVDGVSLEVLGDTLNTNGINLGGTTALTNLTVADGALLDLDLNSMITSTDIFDADGTVRLSSGAAITTGSYNAANAGTFIFEIDYDGVTTNVGDLLFNSGGADFAAAGDTFQFVRAVGSMPIVGDTITFASGVATAPGTITGDTILYSFAVNQVGPELQLVITENNTISNLVRSDNNSVLANVLLVDMLNVNDTGVIAAQDALLNASDALDFNDELESLSPIIHGGEIRGIQKVSTQTFGLINQRLALLRKDRNGNTGITTGNLTEELEAWWQFYGASGDQDERGGIKGYETTTYGMAAGVDKEMFEDAFFGLSFSWGETTINGKGPGDSDTEVDTYMLSLYGDYDLGRAYINSMVSYGYNDIYTSKTSGAGTRTANYHANYYAMRGEMGYSFMPGKTRIIPHIMGHYGYYDPEAYIEEGPAGQLVTIDSLKVMQVGAGVDLSWLIANGEGSYFVPELRLGYSYDLADEPYVATARFFAGGPVFELQGADPAEQTFDIEMGMTYFSKENWELMFNYDFEYQEDYMSHAGTVRASYKFH